MTGTLKTETTKLHDNYVHVSVFPGSNLHDNYVFNKVAMTTAFTSQACELSQLQVTRLYFYIRLYVKVGEWCFS